jgi:predicted TIM-barrel fold metal-dependent hydrolase
MILDVHVHISALTEGHGSMSPRLLNSLAFRFMRWKFGLVGADARTEADLAQLLVRTVDETRVLDGAVVLAFDGVYDDQGAFDAPSTHLYVTNDYVIELSRRFPKLLFGASVHPYRRDWREELEKCVRNGAVLLKWLPITQRLNPADPRCFEFYDALRHYGLPLLCHTGGEKSLPQLAPEPADPMLLLEALRRGVTVIMAHCATRSVPSETCYVDVFMRLAREFANCFGDTSALNLPTRSYAYRKLFDNPDVLDKLVHGSDWPILALPPVTRLGIDAATEALLDDNWMRRDLWIKRKLGFDDEYFRRASKVLRLPRTTPQHPPTPATSPVLHGSPSSAAGSSFP